MPPSIANRNTVWYVLMSFATSGPVGQTGSGEKRETPNSVRRWNHKEVLYETGFAHGQKQVAKILYLYFTYSMWAHIWHVNTCVVFFFFTVQCVKAVSHLSVVGTWRPPSIPAEEQCRSDWAGCPPSAHEPNCSLSRNLHTQSQSLKSNFPTIILY